MALVRSIFGMQFSQKQGQITQNNNKKCLPRRLKCGFEDSPSLQAKKEREKHTPKIKVATKNSEKEQRTGKQTLHFDWFASHFRHSFVTNLHYDGTMQRHLGARNNQSAIRNEPT